MSELLSTAQALVAPGKGILAADESIATMSARLESAGVPAGTENRRAYRELLLTTPDLARWISGIILCDETVRQRVTGGTPFPAAAQRAGILTGVKVDTGTTRLPFGNGGLVTEGLDGLRARLESYREAGAAFAKWRAVIGPYAPGRPVLRANTHALARYAGLCQEAGIVPIVEPEFLMNGDHGIAVCQAVTANALKELFDEMHVMGVDPRGVVLKPNMVVSGTGHSVQADPREVARRTLAVLTAWVPAAVPGVAFLSGGQSNQAASSNLRAINERAVGLADAPWRLTFSFGRALVDDALRTWRGATENVEAAQRALADNCRRAAAAADALTAWYPPLVDAP
jgi:fructose-bisphosphate aldolase class I